MEEIKFRFGKLDDIESLLVIQQNALAVLDDASQLEAVTTEELAENIDNGLLGVAIIDGEMAAFRSMHLPVEDYLGHYAGVTDDTRDDLIYSDITIVDPKFRGLSLQRRLGKWLFEHFEQDYTLIMATVHPDNIASLKDKFHHGMVITAVDKLYGNKLRYIFKKDVGHKYSYEEVVAVERADIERIGELLSSGYYGYALEGESIIFGKNVTTTNE